MTKREWVLKGRSVYYASADSIEDTLRYDFVQEREFSYAGLSGPEVVRHVARFISGIWQIHPFGEGNTRTTAVFTIQYLRSMGYELNNEPFGSHSWYFRNALVRANFEDVTRSIAPTTAYLERFLENQLIGTSHELKNRYLHLDWQQRGAALEAAQQVQVTQQVGLLLKALGDDELSLKELMARLSLADRNNFMKHYLNPALEAGLIERTIPNKPTSRLQRYRRTSR
jgi:prophage maintenance system killer protein